MYLTFSIHISMIELCKNYISKIYVCRYILLSIENIMFIIACDDTRLYSSIYPMKILIELNIYETRLFVVFLNSIGTNSIMRAIIIKIYFFIPYKHMIMILIFRDDDDDDDAFAGKYNFVLPRNVFAQTQSEVRSRSSRSANFMGPKCGHTTHINTYICMYI